MAVELRDGPRPHRRPAGRGRRRRLHGARRRGRRLDLGEAGACRSRWRASSACRSCGWSTAPAAAARSRRYETTGYTYVPRNPGWEHVVDNLAKVPVVALGLGSVAGLGAARLVTVALFADGEGHLADVRRRSAGGGAARREGHQGGAGRHRDPRPQRRGRRRGRERGRGVRPHAAVPLLPAVLGRRACRPRSRATTIPTAARRR